MDFAEFFRIFSEYFRNIFRIFLGFWKNFQNIFRKFSGNFQNIFDVSENFSEHFHNIFIGVGMIFEKKLRHFQPVLVRDDTEDPWFCDFFSYYDDETTEISFRYVCMGGRRWRYCIPYKGNKHLVGTANFPDITEGLEFGDKVMVRDYPDTPYRKGIFVEYNSEHSTYVVLSKSSHAINEWQYCEKGWDDDDSK